MKIGAALATDLCIPTAALNDPGADVLHSLHRLGVDAQAAVPTYLGLSVTVDGSEPTFTLATVEDGAATCWCQLVGRAQLPSWTGCVRDESIAAVKI